MQSEKYGCLFCTLHLRHKVVTSVAANGKRNVSRSVVKIVQRSRVLDLAVLALASVVFLTIALYQIELPGLYPDEAFDVIPTMQLALGHDVELLRGAHLDLFGTKLPLMSSSDYQGVTSTYLALPFFTLFGINVFSLRLMTVLVGVLAIVVTFYLAKEWFGPTAARLTALLLAVSPAWIFWSRLGVYVVSPVVPIACGALLAFTLWVRGRASGRGNASLYLGAFLLGLGMTTKLLFLWFIVALAVCATLLWGRALWEARERAFWGWRRRLSVGVAATAAFALGAFPFILYNAQTRGTYYLLRDSITNFGGTTHGVDNSALLRNLWTKADALKVLMDGGYFWFQGDQGRVYSNPFTPMIFSLSALGLLALVLWRRRETMVAVRGPLLAGLLGVGVSLLWCLLLVADLLGEGARNVGSGIAIMSALLGVLLLAGAGVVRSRYVAQSAALLLVFAVFSGALWWFAGGGRPDGPAPGAWLGLWPVDAAGILFWLCGFGVSIVLAMDRHPVPRQRPIVVALAVTGLVVGQSAVTLSGLWSTHLIMILPILAMVIAAFASETGRVMRAWWSRGRARAGAILRIAPAVLLVGAILVADLAVDYLYHRDLAKTGGGSTFSDAIYSLADYVEKQPTGTPVVAMDWGFKRPLQFLTLERVNPPEIFGYSTTAGPEFASALAQFLADPRTLYLFHTPEGTAYQRMEPFAEAAKVVGKEAVLEKEFYHRDGAPVYRVYRVR